MLYHVLIKCKCMHSDHNIMSVTCSKFQLKFIWLSTVLDLFDLCHCAFPLVVMFLGSFYILSFPAVSYYCRVAANYFPTLGINSFSSYCICWMYWLLSSQQDHAVCGWSLYIVQGLNQAQKCPFIPSMSGSLPNGKRHLKRLPSVGNRREFWEALRSHL